MELLLPFNCGHRPSVDIGTYSIYGKCSPAPTLKRQWEHGAVGTAQAKGRVLPWDDVPRKSIGSTARRIRGFPGALWGTPALYRPDRGHAVLGCPTGRPGTPGSGPGPPQSSADWGLGERHSHKLWETCRLLHYRPPHTEDPPVFPSIRESPYRPGTDGENRREASRRWLLSEPRPARLGLALLTEASLREKCPTLEISGQVHRVPGTLAVEMDAGPLTRSTARFPGDHTSRQVSHPHPRRGREPREDLGTWGRGGGPATVLSQVEWARAGATHGHGRVLPWGLRPAPRLCG